MIDFRYHIVSLTAVFLALAVGVVLGTTALKGPILTDLRGRVTGLADENRSLRKDLRVLKDQSGKQDSFADEVAPALLANRLTGKTVAIVSGPGASTKALDVLVTDLGRAGSKIVSKVRLANDFTDPRRSAEIKGLVSQLLPPGIQVPVSSDGPAQAGALLGAVLVHSAHESVPPAARSAVLQGFQSLGLLAMDGEVTDSADLALILVGNPVTGSQAKPRNASNLSFVEQFDSYARATVVAGSTTDGAGNVIAAIRNDGTLARTVSTVDDLDLAAGQVAVVLALADEIRGRSGQYGIGVGATARVPTLTP
ncbi:MAG: copper transporter [Actinomycetota bacterium]|nr:copper transporter [Actinomycetota bacterium]